MAWIRNIQSGCLLDDTHWRRGDFSSSRRRDKQMLRLKTMSVGMSWLKQQILEVPLHPGMLSPSINMAIMGYITVTVSWVPTSVCSTHPHPASVPSQAAATQKKTAEHQERLEEDAGARRGRKTDWSVPQDVWGAKKGLQPGFTSRLTVIFEQVHFQVDGDFRTVRRTFKELHFS